MSALVHISSILIRVQPIRMQALMTHLRTIAGLEIHAVDPSGKLVAVLETDGDRRIVEILDRIQQEPGVYAANLVYHHIESADSLAQEIDHGSDAP